VICIGCCLLPSKDGTKYKALISTLNPVHVLASLNPAHVNPVPHIRYTRADIPGASPFACAIRSRASRSIPGASLHADTRHHRIPRMFPVPVGTPETTGATDGSMELASKEGGCYHEPSGVSRCRQPSRLFVPPSRRHHPAPYARIGSRLGHHLRLGYLVLLSGSGTPPVTLWDKGLVGWFDFNAKTDD
jgi:hypothetical protein